MRYSYLLFDADDTLFDFPKAASRAFAKMCQIHGIPYTPEAYRIYHEINLELWAAFDRGEVSKDFVVLERCVRFLTPRRSAGNCGSGAITCISSPTPWPPYSGTASGAVSLRICSTGPSSPRRPGPPSRTAPISTTSGGVSPA